MLDVSGVYFWLCYGVGSILGVGPLYLLETLKAEQWNLGKDKPGLFDTDDTDTDIETNVWKSLGVVLVTVSVNKPLLDPVFVRNEGQQTSTPFVNTHVHTIECIDTFRCSLRSLPPMGKRKDPIWLRKPIYIHIWEG